MCIHIYNSIGRNANHKTQISQLRVLRPEMKVTKAPMAVLKNTKLQENI